MVTKEALTAARAAYDIEAACITEMKEFIDDGEFAKAIELLSNAPRIGAAGCGHSGIICQHFAHLMCCIERPARFISPAEAVHGATGFLQKGDVMIFTPLALQMSTMGSNSLVLPPRDANTITSPACRKPVAP